MDAKRQLVTQLPSRRIDPRIEFDGYEEATFDPSFVSNGCWDQNITTVLDDSRRIDPRVEFDGYEEATFDPSFVSNGCWDQKLAHIL
eukprot:scaffold85525_cov37-Attheya_sp.AAC.1